MEWMVSWYPILHSDTQWYAVIHADSRLLYGARQQRSGWEKRWLVHPQPPLVTHSGNTPFHPVDSPPCTERHPITFLSFTHSDIVSHSLLLSLGLHPNSPFECLWLLSIPPFSSFGQYCVLPIHSLSTRKLPSWRPNASSTPFQLSFNPRSAFFQIQILFEHTLLRLNNPARI